MVKIQSYHSSCSFIDVEVEYVNECEERVKRLFDEAVLVFLEEEGSNRPIPPVLGNGVKVDLFKLFLLVRERQGFKSVTRQGLWELVAENLGLDCIVSPSLRLIYFKYLKRMEKWAMEESRIVNWDNQNSKLRLLHELGNWFKGLLENGKCQKRNRAMVFGCNHIEESGSSEVDRSGKRIKEYRQEDGQGQEMSCIVISDDDSAVCVEEQGLDLSYKKQGDLAEMLKWLTSVATCPLDPSIGVIPHSSKWNKFTGNECGIQVTRARNALMVQRDNTEFRCQHTHDLCHQTLNHPSMYENDRKSIARLRYSIRRPDLSKNCSSSCCNGRLVSRTNSRYTNCKQLTRTRGRADLVAGTYGGATREIPRRYVSLGRNFQAQVDEWTGSVVESDTKWLGTRLWPLENEEASDLGDDMIGKGRSDSCSCDNLLPGSVECMRFHIAEKRWELKRELGDVFFHWRFNLMGEEVSLRWTEREERRFKGMIISDPQSFWKIAKRWFRGKTRKELVSYYFNVFLINRRRYQNRVTPRQIDSDDEANFGCVGSSFGRDAVSSICSDIMICSQNNQCYDLD